MSLLLTQLTLGAGAIGLVWLLAKKVKEARRIYNFHEEL